jgi:hypothetical protein
MCQPEVGTGTERVVGSSPHKGNAEILKAEKLRSGPQDGETTRPRTTDYGTKKRKAEIGGANAEMLKR